MALVPSINVCVRDACSTIIFKETTGAYNVTTNPTGYGAPNPTVVSVTAAGLTVTPPSGAGYSIDMLAEGFPTSNEDLEFELTDTPYEDGLWTFVYTVTSGATTYTATYSALFHCTITCCVNKMLLDIDTECDCDELNSKKIQEYTKAKAFLDALKGYAYCGSTEKFDNIYTILQRMCGNTECKTCN
jgi:hypothetical protein